MPNVSSLHISFGLVAIAIISKLIVLSVAVSLVPASVHASFGL
jgi:hypothetical protein